MRRLFLLSLLLFVTACDVQPRPSGTIQLVAGGDARDGQEAIREYGCNACHEIPGIRGPHGYTGPSLRAWSERRYIVGTVPNKPEHLVVFIQNPHAIRPGSAMPNLDVSAGDARDIAAYLYTLRPRQSSFFAALFP